MKALMIIKEVYAKTILSKSKVMDYTVNPYIGCEHGCTYCYARFMKRFTGHKEKWGTFVDLKINAPKLLQREIKKKPVGRIWISGTCDPYQPLESKYELTKKCLEILSRNDWPITIQTKSPLVRRDSEILRKFSDVEIGFSIATANDQLRKLFEPDAPSIGERFETVEELHAMGFRVFVMIAPLLPEAEYLVKHLRKNVDYVLIDKMNYHHADWVYRKYGLNHAMTQNFLDEMKGELAKALNREKIPHKFLY